jgi:diguanylate cyclase (GGDEF)-like protein
MPTGPRADHPLFEHAPISLWEQDFSGIKRYLDDRRAQGVADLRGYLERHPQAVDECMGRIVVLAVNRKTLELFAAESQPHLLDNLHRIFRAEMRAHFTDELLSIWEGQLTFQCEGVNHSLAGEPIDIRLRWSVLPGFEQTYARVLVSISDIREQKRAERALAASEAHFRGLFEHAPVSLWEQDFSGVRRYLDDLRAQGVSDLGVHLDDHPEAVDACMARIVVLDVNQRTLDLFGARDKPELLANLSRIFRDEMRQHFRQEMIDIWNGKRAYEGEGINYALNGDPLDIELRWSVLPGAEETFARVLVSLTDITARRKAENYLRYLGTHDVLTGLFNRAFFEEERARLERGRIYPISIVIADLDGLKHANDSQGHEAGDALLRRAAEVLKAAFRDEDVVARVGGDEFAILLPAADATAAEQSLQRIRSLQDMNNTFYQGPPLSFSLGAATGYKGDVLAVVQRRADDRMYAEKALHHRHRPR